MRSDGRDDAVFDDKRGIVDPLQRSQQLPG
jgi:hypothetical protein